MQGCAHAAVSLELQEENATPTSAQLLPLRRHPTRYAISWRTFERPGAIPTVSRTP